jgi:hypothetical protein
VFGVSVVELRRFNNTVAQGAAVGFGLILLMIALSKIVVNYRGNGISASIYLFGGVWFVIRGSKASSVSVGADGLVTKSMVRTRQYDWAEIASASVQCGNTGMNGHNREYIEILRVDGESIRFKELNAPANEAPGDINEVRRAVSAINEVVSRNRPDPAAGLA